MLDEQIAALVAEREQAEEELTDSAGAREQATAALYRLRSGGERLAASPRVGGARSLPRSAPSSRLHARTIRPPRSSSKRPRATLRPTRRAPPASAHGCRSRPRSAGRASARSSAVRRRELKVELDDVLARRADTEGVLTGGGRDALLTLRGAAQRVGVRQESAQRLLAELQLELVESRQVPSGPTPAELGRAADEADAAARAALREREDLEARVTHGARAPRCARAVARRARRHPAGGPRARRGWRAAGAAAARGRGGHGALGRRRARPSRLRGRRGEPAARTRADRPGDGRGSRLVARARRTRSAPARRPAGRPARPVARLDRARGHHRRHRLGPAARRALVRRRDGRGRPARARRPPPRAARRGGGAGPPRGRGRRSRRAGCRPRPLGRGCVCARRAPAHRAARRSGPARTARRRRRKARRDLEGCGCGCSPARVAARRASGTPRG